MDWFGYSLGHDVRQVFLGVDVVESNILLGHLLLDQVPPQVDVFSSFVIDRILRCVDRSLVVTSYHYRAFIHVHIPERLLLVVSCTQLSICGR